MSRKADSKAAKPTAQHCAELIKPGVVPADMVAEFERFGARTAPALRKVVSEAFSDPSVQVRPKGVRAVKPAELAKAFGPLAACSLYDLGNSGRQALLAIDGQAMLEQLDRVLGGTGELGEDLPSELPVSATLFAQRLAQLIMAAVSAETEGVEATAAAAEIDLQEVLPYPSSAELALLEFEVGSGESRPWKLQLAVETAALPSLLPRQAADGTTGMASKKTLSLTALADLPLPARATLVDMNISLQRLAHLEVGAVLPIMVARSVPLQVGDAIVARGTVGELDDQTALQITTSFSGKEAQ